MTWFWTPRRTRAAEKPTVNRFLYAAMGGAVVMLFCCWGLGLARAQTATVAEPSVRKTSRRLSPGEATRLALQRPAVAALVSSRAGEQRASARETGLFPNPKLRYQREQVLGNNTAFEEVVAVSQRIPLSEARGLRKDALLVRAEATRSEGKALRQRITAETRRRYYRVVHRQQRALVLARWVEEIEEAQGIIARRHTAGDASQYETQRIARELRRARADWRAEKVRRDSAWLELTAFTRKEDVGGDWPKVTHRLLPQSQAPPSEIDQEVATRPDIEALSQQARAAEMEQKAASRGWVPDLTLSGGWRSVNNTGVRRHGFIAGLGVSVPLFDRGQNRKALARAREDQASAERSLRETEARAQARALWLRYGQLTRAARDFRKGSLSGSRELMQTARAGYRGGELSLLELLDVYDSVAQDRLRFFDLAWAARRAKIDFELSVGRSAP